MKMLALLAGLTVQSALAASAGDYAMVFPIETDGSSAAWQIELNTEVYRWSQDANLRDIAIFNSNGQQVATAIWQVGPADKVDEHSAELPVFALPAEPSMRAGSNLQLIVDRDAEGRVRRIETNETGAADPGTAVSEWLLDSSDFREGIDAITLSWSSPDSGVIARFDVDGSDDLQKWHRIRSDATIALFERDGLRIERRVIELDGGRYRYLRLHRLDSGPVLAGWRIEARRQQHRAETIVNLQWIDAETVETMGGIQRSNTVHLYALPAAVPASLLRIDLANDNALAELNVLTPIATANDKTNWMPRARLVAYRLRQDGAEIDSGEIHLPGVARMHELRIDSANPLSQAPRVRVGYVPDRLVFLAEGSGPFLLAVGSRRERRRDYPVEAAISSLRKQFGANWQPPLASLAGGLSGAGASALAAPQETQAWKRGLLWAVLILAAAIVGGMSITLLRGNSKGRAEDRQQPPEK